MKVIDKPKQDLAVALHYNWSGKSLSGWSAPRQAELAAGEPSLSLMAGSILLGTIRRDRARPDVDAHLGYAAATPGFDVADYGLAAFARICGLKDLAIQVELPDGSFPRERLVAEDGPIRSMPLGTRHGLGGAARLVDLWLQDSRKLCLRFESSSRAAKSLDAYQCSPVGELLKVAADRSIGDFTSMVEIVLANSFSPVLLLFKGEDLALDAIDIVPFPSLARGGLHAAERLLSGHGGDDVVDTATTSAEYLRALGDRLCDPRGYVAQVELDASLHTGLEPILNDDLLYWLGRFLKVDVRIAESTDGPPEFISEKIERYRPEAMLEGHKLLLPADCVPTIASLVNAVPEDAGEQIVTGSFAIVDCRQKGPIWSVWVPPFSAALEGFRPPDAAQFAPMLAVRGGRSTEGRSITVGWPLALAIRSQPTRIVDVSPFETAPRLDEPEESSNRGQRAQRVSALILFNHQSGSLLPLLESLARQKGVAIADLVLCVPSREASREIGDALAALFPRRHAVLSLALTAGRLEQIVAARAKLTQDLVLIVDAATVLPDSRTLATLEPMLSIPDVASAGCLVRPADEKKRSACAGYSLSQIGLRGVPAVAFEPIDPSVWRGPATYPVVANTASALVTRRDLLAGVSAGGSSDIRQESDDLLLGIQLIRNGGINLCTTMVSAYSTTPPARPSQAAISIPYSLSPEVLLQITQGSTLVQRIQ